MITGKGILERERPGTEASLSTVIGNGMGMGYNESMTTRHVGELSKHVRSTGQ